MNLERELEMARAAARRAGEIALRYAREGYETETKADLSPVTIADREAERAMLQLLEEAFPEDGFLGEEGARKPSRSGRRWIIDPVDGTRDFVRGNPTWGVLLALEAGGDAAVGICHLPAQSEMYFAARDAGAYLNDQRIQVSGIAAPDQAVVCVNGLNEIANQPFAPRLLDWLRQFWAVRSMGGCQDAMLVAAGKADAWIEPNCDVWDVAPLKIIAEEAGAAFFNFDGGSTMYGGNCVICVPALKAEVRRLIGVPETRHPAAVPPRQHHT